MGAAAFLGWELGLPELTRFSPTQESMKVNTSLCLMMAAAVLLLVRRREQRPAAARIAIFLSVVGILVALGNLIQTIFGHDLGIDELLAKDPYPLGGYSGRMAPNTAVSLIFGFVGLGTYAAAGARVWSRHLLVAGTGVVLLLTGFSLVGHAANISAGRQWGQATVMALPTSLALLAFGVGLVSLLRETHGLRWYLGARQTGTLTAGLISLITAATLGWEASVRLHESSQALVAAARSQVVLSELLSAAQDLESVFHRAFLPEDNQAHPSLSSIRERLPELISRLRAELPAEASRADLDRIETGLVALIDFEARQLALLSEGSSEEVLRQLRSGEGDRLLAGVRGAIQFLQADRNRSVAFLEAEANRWRRGSTLVLFLAGLIAVITLSAGLISLNTEAAQRQAGETRFRGIFNSTLQFIGLLKPDGTVIETNQAALDFVGARLEDVVGRPFWETAWWKGSPQDKQRLQESVRRAAAGEAVRHETEHIGTDGRRIIVDFSIKPARNEAGDIVYLVPEGRDITAAKEFERALAESEARWNFALSASDLGVWDWNTRTNEVYYSERWAAMLGYHREELGPTVDEWANRIHPDDVAHTLALVRDHLEGRTPLYRSEHRIRAKDGRYRWVLDQGKVILRSDDGSPLRVVGTHADIDAQKIAEQQAAELQAQITSILEFSPNLITLIDREGRYLLAGPRAAAAIGLAETSLVGKSFRELMPAAMADVFAERIARMNAHPEPFEVEDIIPTPAGDRIFQTQLFPVTDARGNHVATGGIARDVTDARKALAAVQSALAEREVLLREIHHRVKNNLQTISSLLNLQARALSDPALRAPFEDSKRRIMSMSLIHDQLYRHDDLARIDFAHYVDDLIKLQRTTLGPGLSRIATEIDIRIPPVGIAVAVPCGLIINELFANACKHAFPLGRAGTVRLSMTAEGDRWQLLVTDDGVGAPAFSAAGGVGGLGLQLIKALVKQLNGTMEESAGERGRRTVIRFPAPLTP